VSVAARDGAGPKIARSVTSCAECLAWGRAYAQGVCLACYNFAARNRLTSGCAGCGRRLPLKKDYCRLCWCQARADRDALAADARSAVVLAAWLPQVRDHQLFFAGMDHRRARARAMPPRRGMKGRPRKLPPPVAIRPWPGGASSHCLKPSPAPTLSGGSTCARDRHPPAHGWPGRCTWPTRWPRPAASTTGCTGN